MSALAELAPLHQLESPFVPTLVYGNLLQNVDNRKQIISVEQPLRLLTKPEKETPHLVLLPETNFLTRPVFVSPDVTIVGGQWPHTDTAGTFMVGNEIIVDIGTIHGLSWVLGNIDQAGYDLSKIKQILITHVDMDHVEAAFTFQKLMRSMGKEIKILVPQGAKKILAEGDVIQMGGVIYQRKPVIKIPGFTILEHLIEEIPEGPIKQITDVNVRAINTSGHVTPHMSYLINDVLIAGDVFGCIADGRSSLPKMRDSLRSVLHFPFSKVVESHTDAPKKPYLTRQEYIDIVLNFAISYSDLRPGFNRTRAGR